MAHEPGPIDISNQPELMRLVEEVSASGKPRRLRRHDEDVAQLVPIEPGPRTQRAARSRGKATSADDPLWTIVGLAHGKGPTDVSENKYHYLAAAYDLKHE